MVAVVSWFSQHRSKAVAISQMGFSFGGLCVPLVVFALESYGWRVTAFVSGVIVIAVGLPLAQVIRHRPGPYGEVVDGIAATPVSAEKKTKQAAPAHRDLSAREAMRTRAFWLISLGHALALLTVSSLMVHFISHVTEGPMQFTLAAAGGVVAFMTATQVGGQFIGGFLGDRFNKRYMAAACLAAHGLGLVTIAYATTPWMIMLGAFIHGLGWGVRGPLMTAMRADYFGASSFGTIMGFFIFDRDVRDVVWADFSWAYCRSHWQLRTWIYAVGSWLFSRYILLSRGDAATTQTGLARQLTAPCYIWAGAATYPYRQRNFAADNRALLKSIAGALG